MKDNFIPIPNINSTQSRKAAKKNKIWKKVMLNTTESHVVDQITDVNESKMTFFGKFSVSEIAIGSTNKIKVKAVINALNNENIRVIPCAALSKVSAQPLTDEETLQGAINRAKDCFEKSESFLAIGLEAGITLIKDQLFLSYWGAIVDRNHNTYFTNGPLILLPKSFQKALFDGTKLEDIMHLSVGIENLGSKEGAIGVFTQNQLNREQVMTMMVKALVGQYSYYQTNSTP